MADTNTASGKPAIANLDIRTALLGLLIFLISAWIVRSFRKNRIKNLPPGPKTWPLVGCLPELLFVGWKTNSFDVTMRQLREKYGPVCHLALPFGFSIVLVSGSKGVNEVLTSADFEQRITDDAPDENPVEILRGAGLTLASGPVWKEHRKFSSTVLRSFGVGKRSFEDQIATESDLLLKEIDSLNGQPFDPTLQLRNAVGNIICRVVLGKRYEYEDPEFVQMYAAVEGIFDTGIYDFLFLIAPKVMVYLSMIPFFPEGYISDIVHCRQIIRGIVKEHRDTFDSENMRDFIDVYLKEMQLKKEQGTHTYLNEQEILGVIADLFAAGTATTSITLRWALLYMLKYPDVQKRVHEELDSVVGRHRLPSLSDKPNLPFTVAVIHEIQRHASMLGRLLPKYAPKDVDFQGFVIPAGSYVDASLYSVSRDPSIWKDPEDFQPERFLDENGEVTKVQQSIVFGKGERGCLGEQLARMELFIFFSHLMHRYSFQKPSDTKDVNMKPVERAGFRWPIQYDIRAITRD